jgi:stage II sporulation protein D
VLSAALWPFAQDQKSDLLPSQFSLPANPEAFRYIRVLTHPKLDAVQVATDSEYSLVDKEGRQLVSGQKLAGVTFKPDSQGIYFGAQLMYTSALKLVTSDEGIVKVGDKMYQGTIEIFKDAKGKLNVVNDLFLETYLRGVLPKEVSVNWPEETLKAQAIASRTYALFKMIEKQNEPYDVAADVSSQVFGGKDAHHKNSDQAIKMTEGLIMTYQGRIFPAFFHSNSGGYTTQASNVWRINENPVFRGVESSFSLGENHGAWKDEFAIKEIETALQKLGVFVKGITQIEGTEYDASGRPTYLVIHHSKGKKKILSSEFRLALGAFKFKSTRLTSILKMGDKFSFRGYGWGHGVGLCQYGSKKLGTLGYTHQEILSYYYPGSRLLRYFPA